MNGWLVGVRAGAIADPAIRWRVERGTYELDVLWHHDLSGLD